ncbi:MAG: 4-alpha-glucanotransferase [Prevotella sp.]
MNIQFNIEYKTSFGEDLILNLVELLPSGDKSITPYRMSTFDGLHWYYNMTLQLLNGSFALNYFYSVETDGQTKRQEWTTVAHMLDLTASKASQYRLYDIWLDIPQDTHLYTSAFTDCLNHLKLGHPKPSTFEQTVRFVVRAPQLKMGERLAILGNAKALGQWNALQAVEMVQHQHHEWIIDLDAKIFKEMQIEFKFAALDEKNDVTPLWEDEQNRTISLPLMNAGDVVVYQLEQVYFADRYARMSGTLVPLFSLRSKGSFGVGDFGDLKTMVDFASVTNQRVLQLLPINDTTTSHTWTDSYPYSCISIFALHPQYCDLRQLPELKDLQENKRFKELQVELNALPAIDYERVNNSKIEYLQLLFAQEGKQMMATDAFKRFFKHTEDWLVPYSQFCYLRDTYGTADFSQWPDHRQWDEQDRKQLTSVRNKAYGDVAFYYFVQFILYAQMTSAHDYACSKRVILKGDVPIGVNRYGCDVWMEPKYFNMNGQAGAPPDEFSINGQNWGFPTYNWEEMLKDGCAWWVRRFRNMAMFFDAYRIDHVLGFFRIWEIPISSVHGLLGQFSPALAMSREEIASYGLNFQEDLFTKPFIRDWVLDRVFKEHVQEVKSTYLNHIHDDVYELKPEYDTQRKIEVAFEGKETDVDVWIRDGLYAMVDDILFVRDNKNPELFHPRITAQFNFIYESLWSVDKTAFNKLYNEYYYHRNNQFWYQEAMKKLPKMVEATRMLVCAEDLGMVPESVNWVMNQLRILSLEVQSMPKDPKVRFGHLSRNPYLSVDTISSHDMPTLRQWWDENYERTQNYYNTMLYRDGAAPHPLPGWLARDIVSRHLMSPSILCILSIQDWFAIDENLRLANADAERVNIPANPKHYWRYRMHLNIEDMIDNENLKANIAELISQSGRKI